MRDKSWWTNPWHTRSIGPSLGWGLALGFALPVTVTATLYSTGAIDMTRSGESTATMAITVLTAVVLTPAIEEILFRYLLLRGAEWFAGSYVALAMTAVLFGAAHVVTAAIDDALPGALLYALPGTLAGLLFAGAYLLTHTMWLPIALHAGWNLATNTLYGPDAFGAHRLITVVPHAPAPLSGGSYGTDASLLTSVTLVVACAFVLTAAHRRGHLVRQGVGRVSRPAGGSG